MAPLGSANAAHSVVISEFRTSGPAGAEDSFVELFNATGSPVTLAGWTLKYPGADGRPVSVVVPEKTVVPVSGQYLFTGREYSLKAVSLGDASLPSAISGGLQLSDAEGHVCDTVGPRRATTEFREGEGLPDGAFGASREQYACVRKTRDGTPIDTDSNERDFEVVSVTGKLGDEAVRLGAPGPRNLAGPARRQALSTYITTRGISTPMLAWPVLPASTREAAHDVRAAKRPGPSRLPITGRSLLRNREARGDGQPFGTLTVRVEFINRTAGLLRPLDFVVESITCGSARPGTADVHLLRSLAQTSAPPPADGTAARGSVWNAALVEPPTQPWGGGLNATARLALPAGGIAPGASGEAVFVFGVERTGHFHVALGSQLLNLVFEGDTETPWRDLDKGTGQATTIADPARLAMAGAPGQAPGRRGDSPPEAGIPSANGVSAGPGSNGVGDGAVLTASIVVEGNTNDGFDPPSPVHLSALNADDTPGVIRLTFAGALNSRDAENAAHYKVQVNGAAAGIEKVTYGAARGVVSLFVTRGTLHVGDQVTVQWSGLQDAQGLISAGQAGPATVK